MEEKLLRIGEIAAFLNVSVKAIRIYEKKGIVIPAKIDSSTGYRYYTAEQIQILNALLELKSIGFTLNEIKDIMSGAVDNDGFGEALKRKRIAWQESIISAEGKIYAIDKIGGQMPAKKLHELTDDERAKLLVKMVCIDDLSGRNVLSEALWL